MKRSLFFILAVVQLVVLLIFTACSPSQPPQPVTQFLACIYVDCAYTKGEFPIQAQMSSSGTGTAVITITTPDELRSLTYSRMDKSELSYKGLSCITDSPRLPDDAFASAIYNVLWDLPVNSRCTSFKDKVAVFEGQCKSGKYTATTNGKGYIQNISIEELNLSVDFEYN